MKQHMVVTNVRMSINDWLQVKTVASEMGMSVNEYLNFSAQAVTTSRQLFGEPKKIKNRYHLMWNVLKQKATYKPMGWSAEDEAIYSV